MKELLKKILKTAADDLGLGGAFAMAFMVGALVGGCAAKPVKNEVLILRPGQSAVLLERRSVLARIPAQGDALYSGPVMLEEGTVLLKPVVEE